jgi:hypothetical protein
MLARDWLTEDGSAMKSILQTALAVIVIIALSAASQHLVALQMLEQILARNRNTLLAFTIPVAALGFIVFFVQLMLMLYEKGQPMSHEEVEEQFRLAQNTRMLPYTARFSKYRVFGTAQGRQFSEQLPLKDFKRAWQSGAWRHDAKWKARFAVAGGALLMIFGVLATAAVASPIVVALICVASLIYAAMRLTWALWHA